MICWYMYSYNIRWLYIQFVKMWKCLHWGKGKGEFNGALYEFEVQRWILFLKRFFRKVYFDVMKFEAANLIIKTERICCLTYLFENRGLILWILLCQNIKFCQIYHFANRLEKRYCNTQWILFFLQNYTSLLNA